MLENNTIVFFKPHSRLHLALVVEKIWSDIDNSRDEVKKNKKKGGGEEPDDQPGK